METECVIRAAYFRKTRRYAQWITKKEGQVKETLDIKGLEYKKSNFPPYFAEFFKEMLIDILKGAKKPEIDKRVSTLKDSLIGGEIGIEQLGNPTSVKKLNKYWVRKARASEMFSTVGKGAPAAVKAAIAYNDLLKFWELDQTYDSINQGDKIKWVNLKPNPFQIEGIAFLDYDIPEKIRIFIDKYLDRQKTFDSIILNKLEGLYSDISWDLILNPFKKHFFNL